MKGQGYRVGIVPGHEALVQEFCGIKICRPCEAVCEQLNLADSVQSE